MPQRQSASRRLTCLGLPLATALLALGGACVPASAAAAQRFASPASTDATGDCSQSAPCTLAWAVSAAAAGDDVTLAPGTYNVDSPVNASVAVTLHGADGQPAPLLVASPSMKGDHVLRLNGGFARHLAVIATAPQQSALVLNGASGDGLLASASAQGKSDDVAPAALVVSPPAAGSGPSVLRDSVAWNRGPGVDALAVRHLSSSSQDAQGSQGSEVRRTDDSQVAAAGADLVNVTAVATGAGSDAVRVASGVGPVSAIDVIAQGPSDFSAPGGVSVSYSDFRPAASSGVTDLGHNVAGDPQFADATAGDFHEVAGSPTIDAGVTTPQSGAADPDGNPRQLGTAADIGAYEFNPAAPVQGGGDTPLAPGGPGRGNQLPPPLSAPALGRTVDLVPVQGQVRVRLPHTKVFVPLAAGRQVPVGSTVDASVGAVELTDVRDASGTMQTGRFWGGEFRVSQGAGAGAITKLTLAGSLSGCHAGTVARAARSARRRPRSRTVWGSDDHGRFSTRGNDAVATVRGTVWMMQDTCAGTLTKVLAGEVSVRDLHSRSRFLVSAGHQRLVRAHR